MRSYGEAVQVRTAPVDLDTLEVAPTQFLWRGRLYVVRAVLAHWIELGAWWAGPGSRRRRPVPVGAPAGSRRWRSWRLLPGSVQWVRVRGRRRARAAAAR